jgi:hypothetical protein
MRSVKRASSASHQSAMCSKVRLEVIEFWQRRVEIFGDPDAPEQRPWRPKPDLVLRDESRDRGRTATNHDLLAGLDAANQLGKTRLSFVEWNGFRDDPT